MSHLFNKTVLVTGAGGSIGSELCRQILRQSPSKLILFDNSELALYNIDRELDALVHGTKLVPILGGITNGGDMEVAFDEGVDVVFHAAAYKHVTLCEKNPTAAYRVNVDGTRLLVDIAKAWEVPTFILVSTDKAVRPTCVMGKTKKLAEDSVREAGYTVVRLGNVMGSSGSVLPLWKEQIAAGKPVTITHPNATRYFTTVDYAASKIIMAAHPRAEKGVLVMEMGSSTSIVEAARCIGAKDFKYIGLRPGEKLHEELFEGVKRQSQIGGLAVDDTSFAAVEAA